MEPRNFKIGVCLPLTWDYVHARVLDSVMVMERPYPFMYYRPDFPSQQLDALRNELVSRAIADGCTHIFMIDTDQPFPPDIVSRLLAHNLPIVYGKVHRRYPPFDPILLRFDEAAGKYYQVPDEEWTTEPLVEVDITGAGCMLVEATVFADLEEPWFKFVPADPATGEGHRGEDAFFCEKAKAAGFRLFVDTTLNITHLAQVEVNADLYRLFKLIGR